MLWNLIITENTKNMNRRLLWVELGLLGLIMVVFTLLMYSALRSQIGQGVVISGGERDQLAQMITWPTSLVSLMTMGSGNALGGLLLIILVGAVVAQEYTWRTVHLWVSRGASRPSLLAARFVALLLPAFLFVLATLLVGGLLTAFFSLQLNGSLHLEQLDGWQLLWSLLRTAYTLLPYASLTFFLAVATRSVVAAIGGGLAYALLLESALVQVLSLFSDTFQHLSAYLPGGLANSLLKLNNQAIYVGVSVNGSGLLTPEALGPLQAVVGIAFWTLLFFGLALWAFSRQDLTQ